MPSMPSLSVLNLGDNVERKIKDADSIHSILINGVPQTVENNEVDIDIQSIVDAKVARALQGISFSVNFTTGELTYTIGS